MTDLNHHITSYLQYYIALPDSPRFAVLLRGDWGCGKTWFIKNFINHYLATGSAHRFLYLTLYGVSTYTEIEDQIFQQLHPLLSSKGVTLAGKILKGVLKASLRIDLDGQATATVTPDLDGVAIPEYLRKTDDCVLVFDDLERSQMPAEAILGYINGIVEHQGLKVIIVANEAEMDSCVSAPEPRNYRRIKEKLIGKSFRVSHDVHSAIESFLGQLQYSDTKAYLESTKDKIVDVFVRAGFQNLRHLHRTFLDFERFHRSLPIEHRAVRPLLDELLALFLAFSFEIQAGTITARDIAGFRNEVIKKAALNSKEGGSAPPIVGLAEKYSFISWYDLILPERTWSRFFSDGFVSEAELRESINMSSFGERQSMPAWATLWHYRDIEDQEFAEALQKVERQWSGHEFTVPEIILHVSGLFLRLSAIGLRAASIEETAADCKAYIDRTAATEAWLNREVGKSAFDRGVDRDSYGGLGYTGTDLPVFKELCEYLDRRLEEARVKSMPNAAARLLEMMMADTERFSRSIRVSNSEDQVYCRVPVFQYMRAEDFVKALVGLTNEKKLVVTRALKERYCYPGIVGPLNCERDFLQQVVEALKKEVDARRGTVSGYLLEQAALKTVENAVVALEKISGG